MRLLLIGAVLFSASRSANAECVIHGAKPTVPLPTMEIGQEFSIRSTKHVVPPNGFAHGHPGRVGDILINPGRGGEKRLPTRYADYPLKIDDVFRLDSPGGGGYGDPLEREPARVLDDVREGVVSPEAAARDYGVVVTCGGGAWTVDEAATAARRANRSATSPKAEGQQPDERQA